MNRAEHNSPTNIEEVVLISKETVHVCVGG